MNKKIMGEALTELINKPSLLTAAIVDNGLWEYHKLVALARNIPAEGSGWFVKLAATEETIKQQRNAIDVIMKVMAIDPSSKEIKEMMEHPYIEPLLVLNGAIIDAITKEEEEESWL